MRGAEAVGGALSIQIAQAMCRDARAIQSAIAEIGSKPAAALIVLPAPFFAANRELIALAAAAAAFTGCDYEYAPSYPFAKAETVSTAD